MLHPPGGALVAVGWGVFVGAGGLVGIGVLVAWGVLVGAGVFVGKGVFVGRGVLVGTGVAVAVGVSTGRISKGKKLDSVVPAPTGCVASTAANPVNNTRVTTA